MLRAVLDTYVVVSGTISSSGAPFEVLEAWRHRRFTLVTSPQILREVERVFGYPRIRKTYGLDQETIERVGARLAKYALVTPGELAIDAIEEDPADDLFLACAVEGDADLIVSGDSHLLDLTTFRGAEILTARRFLSVLDNRMGRAEEEG